MADFNVNILGCGSALPTTRHAASSQVIDLRDKLYMIDCGEGTQVQMRRMHIKFARLNHIFITHAHGDHCFGIPGLISTLGMLGRNGDLTIHAPSDLKEYIQTIVKLFCQGMPYFVRFNPVNTNEYGLVMEDRSVSVYSIPLKHRIPCCGPATPARRYAYCSDTGYFPKILPYIHQVDLLYHEATFAEADAARAYETFHSTAKQAATIARDAEVKRLLIGHYSARYEELTPLLDEAKSVFPQTCLAQEGMSLSI